MPPSEAPPFDDGPPSREALRQAITNDWFLPEAEAVQRLLPEAQANPTQRLAAQGLARQLLQGLSDHLGNPLPRLLQAFPLSSPEGQALMCLAEALLRTPDAATRHALIRDKLGPGHWQAHLAHSPGLWVQGAACGLFLAGQWARHTERAPALLSRWLRRGGEPWVLHSMTWAMQRLGEHFIAGETIETALPRGARQTAQGWRHSYDMLGEAAQTAQDAERYFTAYEHAIHAIGQTCPASGSVLEHPGISIKLSALHPRYQRSQYARVMQELGPRLLHLARLAHQYGLGLNIDAEESERLELSLDVLEHLCQAPELQHYNGIGFVVQAYQKRAPGVIDWLIQLARRTRHRLMVRLVKGAYWDSEIKRAQTEGAPDYPVYTRKAHTDVAYLACARRLLAAPDAVYPQFATHNAHTLAAVYHLADPAQHHPEQYEFQCLHGMGEALYERVIAPLPQGGLQRPCRIYAPVGRHDTLLAYLVRRLLENGANTSFVPQMAHPDTPWEQLLHDPVDKVVHETPPGAPHPRIPRPPQMHDPERVNPVGRLLAHEGHLHELGQALDTLQRHPLPAPPPATPAAIEQALQQAHAFAPHWGLTPAATRAACLERAAHTLQEDLPRLSAALILEAHKTATNAVAEVREAIDFLRYYAAQIRADWAPHTHHPLGVVACISPWNFPVAIFTGQVAAALAAGNSVVAKPAAPTPRVALQVVQHLWAAGVPQAALHLLHGDGATVGAALVHDHRVQGVLFTGSTSVARELQQALAHRVTENQPPIALVAETGGINAMIVDATAHLEQAVQDILTSAFDSAGQRCSALRLLCVQDTVADRLLHQLQGAMCEWRLGRTDHLATDMGPLIHASAHHSVSQHVAHLQTQGHRMFQAPLPPDAPPTLVPPTLIELHHVAELTQEVFGPVLHVVRYRASELDPLLNDLSAQGHGLTLGLHTRLDRVIEHVTEHMRVGNQYVNRNMIGAVVGVQPFGGEGLSGTGLKAGGPLYLYRLLRQRPPDALARALRWALRPPVVTPPPMPVAWQALCDWAQAEGLHALLQACAHFQHALHPWPDGALNGPTGELNRYRLVPRQGVLCLAENDADLLQQLALVVATRGRAVWCAEATALHQLLPQTVREHIELCDDSLPPTTRFDTVLYQGPASGWVELSQRLARRSGPLVTLHHAPNGTLFAPETVLVERCLSINTAAVGGNAGLLNL